MSQTKARSIELGSLYMSCDEDEVSHELCDHFRICLGTVVKGNMLTIPGPSRCWEESLAYCLSSGDAKSRSQSPLTRCFHGTAGVSFGLVVASKGGDQLRSLKPEELADSLTLLEPDRPLA